MKSLLSILLLIASLISIYTLTSCSSDEPEETACYEFHHSIRYRSVDSQWENYYDTICNITETEAEKYRAENDVNNSEWICNCAKKRITSPHTHKK